MGANMASKRVNQECSQDWANKLNLQPTKTLEVAEDTVASAAGGPDVHTWSPPPKRFWKVRMTQRILISWTVGKNEFQNVRKLVTQSEHGGRTTRIIFVVLGVGNAPAVVAAEQLEALDQTALVDRKSIRRGDAVLLVGAFEKRL